MTMDYISAGDSCQPVMLFVHGWPDTGYLWEHQVAVFAKTYHCCCVHLPLFHSWPAQTYDFPQLAAMLEDTLDEILRRSGQNQAVVIGHDWGAYLTYMLEQLCPQKISAIVTMEVGANFKPENVKQALYIITYQWWLIAAFFIGRIAPPVGRAMSAMIAKIANAPRKKPLTSEMNFPYVYCWRAVLFKKYRGSLIRRYRPQCPVLYLYGGQKSIHFHTDHWLRTVQETTGSNVVCLDNCDHWLMVRDANKTNGLIADWLKSVS